MVKSVNPPTGRDDAADAARFVQEIKETADKLLVDGAGRGEIKLLARALKELRYSFRLLSRFRERRKITIFGSARTPADAPSYQQAVALGRAFAHAGYMVITGAGPGIMEAGHVGAGADMSIGFNIRLPFEQEANEVIAEDEKLVNLNYFFTRKLLFIKETDALVLFPGGFGTLDECYEALTLIQTGKSPIIPILMVDVPGGAYWEHWRQHAQRYLFEAGMISEEDFQLFRITHGVDEALQEVQTFYRVYHSQRYVRGRLVLRLQTPIGDDLLGRLNNQFADILRGPITRGPAHADEANEPHLDDLERLYVPFDRKSFGRLRQLIDLVNTTM